jgi:aminopeptidase N
MIKKLTTVVVVLALASLAYAASEYIHHDLKVTLKPDKKFIRVVDKIYLPANIIKKKNHFLLHGNLAIVSLSRDIKIEKEKGELKAEFFGINTARFEIKKKIPINQYSFQFPGVPGKTLTIEYEGTIHHPIKKIGAEYARGFSETPGIICEKGVYLAGATFWLPWFNDNLVTFKMETTVPEPWDVLSQGRRVFHEKKKGLQVTIWDSPEPMDEVYLVAAEFKEYGLKVGKVNIMAFLREKDDNLAHKYLETTGQYLEMYEKLIGPYPFSKFALIENFWETGYGMPSFTLLGPQVIRFPFILHSSYPHELLHNWWGNSVYVDYESGNWCEGLTTYLADHLIKEQRDQGSEYRKTTLQDYTHYAAGKEEEFPLIQFKARYNALSSSIGYGKSKMLFHMLRRQIGDQSFKKALQHFYKENKYKRATFEDVRKSVEAVTGKDFKDFFQQWVTRSGAPEIRLINAIVLRADEIPPLEQVRTDHELHELTQINKKLLQGVQGDGFLEKSPPSRRRHYLLQFSLEQIQQDKPYALTIPVAITLEGKKEAIVKYLDMTKKKQDFEFSFNQPPLRIDVDPEFDIFRKLHTNEIPPTLSNAFGAKQILILLPSAAPGDFLKGYRELAESWAKDSEGKIDIKMDNRVSALPADKAIWLLGWENLHNNTLQNSIAFYKGNMDEKSVTLDKKKLSRDKHSIIVAVKNKENPDQVVILLSTDRVKALPGLGRKLPHYGKYSYLGFEGDEPTNMFKGQWPAVDSPMTVILDSSSTVDRVSGALPHRESLARLAPLFSSERMLGHIRYLASEDLEGRGLGSKGLEKAAHYIATAFKKAGLEPGGDNHSYYQTWEAEAMVGKTKRKTTLRNVIGIIPGSKPQWADQSVVLCAHYDHLGLGWPVVHQGNEGKIHYGADDNASGVAILLELSHTMGKSYKPERSIVFVAFTGEESGLLGSSYYVKNLEQDRLKNIMAAVNLDTVGRLREKEKLMVIGSSSAREWRFIFMGIGYTTGIESELITQDLDASDQVNFIKAGIPGIQLFSGPHNDYHRPTDTVNKINAAGLVKVAAVARETIVYLSERKEPLTFQGIEAVSHPGPTPPPGGRRVRTGIMPDFAFSGKGVKITMVSPDSPAEKSGIRKDDVIIKLGDVFVNNLREYSNVLKTFKPGDTVNLVYLREGQEYSTTLVLAAR